MSDRKIDDTEGVVSCCCCSVKSQTLFYSFIRILVHIALIIFITITISEWGDKIMKPLLGVIGYMISTTGVVVDLFGIFGHLNIILQYSVIISSIHLIFSILFTTYYDSTFGTLFTIVFCVLDIWIIMLAYMTLRLKIRSNKNTPNWIIQNNTSIPSQYRGIFYMDGNPLPDEIFTFEAGQWFEQDKLLILPVNDNNWTYHNNCKGKCVIFTLVWHAKYYVHFNDDLTYAYIVPTGLKFLGCGEHIRLCKCCVFPTLKRIKDNEYARVNKCCCGCFETGNYTLKRVIDENGKQLDGFELLNKIENDECITVI
eukprot:221878_1